MPKLPVIDSLSKMLGLITAIIVIGGAIYGGYLFLVRWQTTQFQLTQDELHSMETTMAAGGYAVTKHLEYKGQNTDGSLLYQGDLTKRGFNYTWDVNVYKDQSSEAKALSNEIASLRGKGYSVMYDNSTQSWNGGMALHQGASLCSAKESPYAPWVVMVWWTSTYVPSQTPD
jgi:hypothetical protein